MEIILMGEAGLRSISYKKCSAYKRMPNKIPSKTHIDGDTQLGGSHGVKKNVKKTLTPPS